MYALPETGVSISTNKHNCNLFSIADWIMASCLFLETEISKSDVSDILIENQIYGDQDFCSQFIDNIWLNISDFIDTAQIPSLSVTGRAITPKQKWGEDSALSYCLTASIRKTYPTWSKSCGDFLTQGSILEHLTQIALSQHHPNIKFTTTGWSGIKDNGSFGNLIRKICEETKFSEKDLSLWDNGRIKDLGLDVYGYYPGHGNRPSTYFMMFQCASGDNWTEKRNTPNLEIWSDILKTYTSPIRGMAIPFLIEEKDFSQSLIVIKGPLLERKMLLSGLNQEMLPAELILQINDWVYERIEKLPLDE